MELLEDGNALRSIAVIGVHLTDRDENKMAGCAITVNYDTELGLRFLWL